jgi:hypothetical protein
MDENEQNRSSHTTYGEKKRISTLAQRGLEVPSYMVPSADVYLATFASFSQWFLSSSKGQPLLVVEIVAKAKIVLYYASGVLAVDITQLLRMKSIPDWRTEKLKLMFAQHHESILFIFSVEQQKPSH